MIQLVKHLQSSLTLEQLRHLLNSSGREVTWWLLPNTT